MQQNSYVRMFVSIVLIIAPNWRSTFPTVVDWINNDLFTQWNTIKTGEQTNNRHTHENT